MGLTILQGNGSFQINNLRLTDLERKQNSCVELIPNNFKKFRSGSNLKTLALPVEKFNLLLPNGRGLVGPQCVELNNLSTLSFCSL